MDPVGPWSYAYNRLASVQAPSATPSSGDFHHHLATIAAANLGVPTSTSNSSNAVHHSSTGLAVHPATSQLLLQSGFSSNFLTSTQPASTPSNIAYETVFSPFLTHAAQQHSNPKPAHFNNLQTTTQRHRTETYQQNTSSPSQHQQITNLSTQQQQQSPQNSRRTESYQSSTTTTANTNNSNSYFEQVTPTAAASSAPESGFGSFGVMPHESLVPSSLNGSANKTTTNNYGNLNSSFNPVGTQQLIQQQSHHQLQQNASRSTAKYVEI